jgi:predicted DsbA family dithiol-disulfide isomerase
VTNPTIEIFADIWCPFAHAGLRAAARARSQAGRDDVAFIIRAWPLELVNGAAMPAAKAADHARHLRDQVDTTLFAHLDVGHFPSTTLPALTLAHAAYRQSSATGEAVSFALRDAMFEQGRDISDAAVLADLARLHGLDQPGEADRAGVLADWHEGQARGVIGSPHFYCGNTDMFCPGLQITRDETHGVVIHTDAARLAEFLTTCWGS